MLEFSTPPNWCRLNNLSLQESFVYFVILACSQGTGICRLRKSEWVYKFNISAPTLTRYIEKICAEGYATEIDEEGLKRGEVTLAVLKELNYKNVNRDPIRSIGTKDTTSNKGNTGDKATKVDKVANDIYDFWLDERAKVLGRTGKGPKVQRSDVRLGRIRARLDEGFTVEDIKKAIRGCMGRKHNVQGGYIDIELICRNNKITQFIAAWEKQQGTPVGDWPEPEAMREWVP